MLSFGVLLVHIFLINWNMKKVLISSHSFTHSHLMAITSHINSFSGCCGELDWREPDSHYNPLWKIKQQLFVHKFLSLAFFAFIFLYTHLTSMNFMCWKKNIFTCASLIQLCSQSDEGNMLWSFKKWNLSPFHYLSEIIETKTHLMNIYILLMRMKTFVGRSD